MLNLLARIIAFIMYPFVRGRALAEARALTALADQRRAADDAQARREEQQRRDEEARIQRQLDWQLVSTHVTKSQYNGCAYDVVLRFASGRVVALTRKRSGAWIHPGRNARYETQLDHDLINLCEVAVFEFKNKVKVLPAAAGDADASDTE